MASKRLLRYSLIAVFCVATILYLSPPSPFIGTRYPPEYDSLRERVKFVPSSFNWTAAHQYFPPTSLTPLPTGKPKKLPRVQHAGFSKKWNRRQEEKQQEPLAAASDKKSKSKSKNKDNKPNPLNDKRRKTVRYVFLRAWKSYKQQAWLRDELQPVTGGGKTTFGGWAATLVDALDTLWIMGLRSEFYLAAEAAAALDFSGNNTEGEAPPRSANVFETTIRHLGGLLSAYDLSGEPALLAKAVELGDMLYAAFDTPNRLPGFWLDFEDARRGRQLAGTHDPSASPASLGLEFTRLAQLTGDDRYYDAIDRVRAFLARTQGQSRLPGMWPTAIDFRGEDVAGDRSFTLGALADSLYEYLPKMFILTGGLEPSYERMYRDAMRVAAEHILFRPMLPDKEDILFAGNAIALEDHVEHVPEGQHLACFAGGMFLLGGRTFGIKEHVDIGERLTRGCAWAYDAFPTGLMPEIFTMVACPTLAGCEWDSAKWAAQGNEKLGKGFKNARDPRYILRPEAIESVFLLYRVTGQEELREIAWRMFESIIKATQTPLANSAISDVTATGETEKMDSMESFWLAETLKYFYLIFSDPDVISLDEWVLNTEAHPLRRPR